jgi:hypothetical protein
MVITYKVDITKYVKHVLDPRMGRVTLMIDYEVSRWLYEREIQYLVHYNTIAASYHFATTNAVIEFTNADDMANFELRWMILEND